MPFKRPSDYDRSYKLSTLLTGNISSDDIKLFCDCLSQGGEKEVDFDHSDPETNHKALFSFLDAVVLNTKDFRTQKLELKDGVLILECNYRKLHCKIKVEWLENYFSTEQRKFSTVNLSMKEIKLPLLEALLGQHSLQFLNTEAYSFSYNKDEKKLSFLRLINAESFRGLATIIKTFNKYVTNIQFSFLKASCSSWKHLMETIRKMPSQRFKIQGLMVSAEEEKLLYTELVENFSDSNWEVDTANRYGYYRILEEQKAENLTNLLGELIERNQRIKKISHDTENNLKVSFDKCHLTQRHMDTVISALMSRVGYCEIDLSGNDLSVIDASIKIMSTKYMGEVNIKIDDVRIAMKWDIVLSLQLLCDDWARANLIDRIVSTSFAIKAFTLIGKNTLFAPVEKIISLLKAYPNSKFELQNFDKISVDNMTARQIGKKLTESQDVESSLSTRNFLASRVEANFGSKQGLDGILLRIMSRNRIISAFKAAAPIAEMAEWLGLPVDAKPEEVELNLSYLFIEDEYLDVIYSYLTAHLTNTKSVNLRGNQLSFSKLLEWVSDSIKQKFNLSFSSDIFSVVIVEGVIQSVEIEGNHFKDFFIAWSHFGSALSLSKFMAYGQQGDLNTLKEFLELTKPGNFTLSHPSGEYALIQLEGLLQTIIKGKLIAEITLDKFSVHMMEGNIKEVSVNSSGGLAILGYCVEQKIYIKKANIGKQVTEEINYGNQKTFDSFVAILEALQSSTSFTISASERRGSNVMDRQKIARLATLTQLVNLDGVVEYPFGYGLEYVLRIIVQRNILIQGMEKNIKDLGLKTGDIHVLDLTNLFLTEQQISAILTYLQKNEDIQEIILDGNLDLNPKGLITFFEGLKSIPSIVGLTLRRVNLGLEALKSLREYLKLGFLLKLDLRQNNLKDGELVQIIEMIRENRSLYCLDVCENNFTDSVSKSLAAALKDNSTLTHFYFDKISTLASLKVFFGELGWVKTENKKKLKANQSLLKVRVLTDELEGKLGVTFATRNLSPEVKETKSIIESYRKFTEHARVSSALIATTHAGTDIAAFRELLTRASVYTETQGGYLQHILVDLKDQSFLEHLFNTFKINPWLRFQGKTILDLAREKKDDALIQKIQGWMDTLRNLATTSNLINTQTQSSGLGKRKADTPMSQDAKKQKSNKVGTPMSPDAKKQQMDPSNNNASFSLTVTSPSAGSTNVLISDEPMVQDNTEALNQPPLNSIPTLSLSQPVINADISILLILQFIQTQQVDLLKQHWQGNTRNIFLQLFQKTPLQYALQLRSVKCLSVLSELEEDINERDANGYPLVYQLVTSFQEKDVAEAELDQSVLLLQELLRLGADITINVTNGKIMQDTVVHAVARLGNYRCLKALLLEARCPLNATNSQHFTPLMEAVQRQDLKMVVRLLLDKRHKRSNILNAERLADKLKYLNIQELLKSELNIVKDDERYSGIQFTNSLLVQFKKPGLNRVMHVTRLDKEHAWLNSTNHFTIQSLSLTDPEERARRLKELGNPITASMTFVLTSSAYARHANQRYVDVTVALQDIPEFHLTEAFNEKVTPEERQSVADNRQVLDFLPNYRSYRKGYEPRTTDNIMNTNEVDFAQTFRHGERSLLTYVANKVYVQRIVAHLSTQAGFVPNAKCIGVILNIISPRYVCADCEIALLATQHPRTSNFLPLLCEALKESGVKLPQFSPLRIITCVSSYIPFQSERVSPTGTELLAVDFRNTDIILAKDITQLSKASTYTQFRSNQV